MVVAMLMHSVRMIKLRMPSFVHARLAIQIQDRLQQWFVKVVEIMFTADDDENIIFVPM